MGKYTGCTAAGFGANATLLFTRNDADFAFIDTPSPTAFQASWTSPGGLSIQGASDSSQLGFTVPYYYSQIVANAAR